MKIRKKQFLGILIMFTVLLSGSVYGMYSLTVTNRFETSGVKISLTEYQKCGEDEQLWEDCPIILPGDRISKIPRICNEGSDCYIRAKLCFEQMEGIDENCLFGMSSDWMKAKDGYYYYQKIIPSGKSVDIFQGLEIPKDFSQENEGKNISMRIVADAIQSKNFVPVFESDAPWGSVSVVKTEHKGNHEMNAYAKNDPQTFYISYEGNSKSLISNSEDFFQNMPALLPGDVFEDSIQIVNHGQDAVKLYFRSVVPENNDLTENMQLEIWEEIGGASAVYSGSLNAKLLKDDLILGTIPKNGEGKFRFRISVPKELDNSYAFEDGFVQWIFSTEPIVNVSAGNVQTGDRKNPVLWSVLLGGSLLALGFTCMKYIKERKEIHDTDE